NHPASSRPARPRILTREPARGAGEGPSQDGPPRPASREPELLSAWPKRLVKHGGIPGIPRRTKKKPRARKGPRGFAWTAALLTCWAAASRAGRGGFQCSPWGISASGLQDPSGWER